MITPELVSAITKLITTTNSSGWHAFTNICAAQQQVFQQLIKCANPTGMFDHLKHKNSSSHK